MIYKRFKDDCLSALGFGTMRLPCSEDGRINIDQTREMVDYAIKNGVNYFDTAVPYHDGQSESVISSILANYPRDTWYLATKFPGHQHFKKFNPKEIFEGQLRRCKVDYFDYYLYHNVCENSLPDYNNPKWGILEYFVEQRKLGKIRHLGLSSHATLPVLKEILDGPYGDVIEFCQIQLNYLDWTLQKGEEKVKLLTDRNIPIWVMEPVRGGFLAKADAKTESIMKCLRPDDSIASWSFRFLQQIPNVVMTLSGMSSMQQVVDNIKTYSDISPLNQDELKVIEDYVASIHHFIPCTACRYCCSNCPQGLEIPSMIATYNDLSLQFNFSHMMYIESLPEDKRPSACLGCGECTRICPQGINIPEVMQNLNTLFQKYPKWADICKKRNAIIENNQN